VAMVRQRIAKLDSRLGSQPTTSKPPIDPVAQWFMGKKQGPAPPAGPSRTVPAAANTRRDPRPGSAARQQQGLPQIMASGSTTTTTKRGTGPSSTIPAPRQAPPKRLTTPSGVTRRALRSRHSLSEAVDPLGDAPLGGVSLSASRAPISLASKSPEKSARVVLRISEGAANKWDSVSFRGDINLVACPLMGHRGTSVHEMLSKEIAQVLHMPRSELRLSNFAQQDVFSTKKTSALITVFFDRVMSNGVLAELEKHQSQRPRSGVQLGQVGGMAEVVSIDLAEMEPTPPNTPSSSRQTAQSLGQTFLFGIMNDPVGSKHSTVQAS